MTLNSFINICLARDPYEPSLQREARVTLDVGGAKLATGPRYWMERTQDGALKWRSEDNDN